MKKKQQSGNLFEMWMDSQQKMMEQWKDFMNPFMQTQGQESSEKDNWFHPEKWLEYYREWFKMSTQGFEDFLKLQPAGTVNTETWQKVVQSMDVYMQLFNLWTDMTRNFSPDTAPEKVSDFVAKWTENQRKVLDIYLTMNLPEPVKGLMSNTFEISSMYSDTIMQFIKPWLDSSTNLQEKAKAMLRGDHDAYLEFLREWRRAYEESYGKVLRVPALGMSRENFEKLLAGVDSYMQYMAAANEFTAQISKIGSEAMEKLAHRYIDLLKEDKAPKTFREYYRFWVQHTEEAYFEMFKTDSFAMLLGQLVNAGVRFKKRYDDLLVEFIGKFLPIPTSDEMDSVYKATYQLKKENRELTRRTEELEKKLIALEEKLAATAGETAAATAKNTDKK